MSSSHIRSLQSQFPEQAVSFLEVPSKIPDSLATIDSSFITVVILTANCLQGNTSDYSPTYLPELSFVSCIEHAQLTSKVTLLHVLHKNNPFPSITEQPVTLRDVFMDKAVTYLKGMRYHKFSDNV
jgi:hypothetical protein